MIFFDVYLNNKYVTSQGTSEYVNWEPVSM